MLILNKLVQKDFGIVKGTREIIFDSGLNIIQAQNGMGKSTTVQAIEMLLNNNYEGGLSEFINDKSESFYIELYYILNNVEYCNTLSCKNTKTATLTERLIKDNAGNILASGEEAIQYMSQILDPVLTQYSLVAKQKPLDNIVTCKDSERRELFKKIKEIDLEKYINEQIVPVIENTKQEIIQVDKDIYKLENTKYEPTELKTIIHTSDEIDSLKKELQKLITLKTSIEAKQTEYNSKKSSLEDCIKKSTQYKTILDSKNQTLILVNESIAKYSSPEYNKELKKKVLDDFDKQCKIEKNSITMFETELELEQAKSIKGLDELNKNILDIQAELDIIKVLKLPKFDDTNLKSCENKIASLKQDIRYCTSNINSLEAGICPTCGGECLDKAEDWRDKKHTYERELLVSESELKTILDEKVIYDKQVEDNNKLKESKVLLQNTLDSLNLKVENENNRVTTFKNNNNKHIEDTTKRISERIVSKDNDLLKIDSQIVSDIDKEKIRLKDITQDIHTYQDSILTEETLKSGLELWLEKNKVEEQDFSSIPDMENTTKEYDSTITQNVLITQQNTNLLLLQEENKLLLSGYKDNKIVLQTKLFNNEQSRTILLKDFPNYLIDQSIEEVESGMNEFLDMIYYKSLNIELRSTKTSIKLEFGTNKKLPSTRLSGAESKLVSLSFINYFNKLLGLQCIILDEPDSALSASTAEALYESLILMSNIYSQMIVITHSKNMVNYMVSNKQTKVINL